MPTPRKSLRTRRKIVETSPSSSSPSSEDESEVVTEFFTKLNVKDGSPNKKQKKTPKKSEEPTYTTRSGRQIVPKFRASTVGKTKEYDSDSESSSTSSQSLPDTEKPSVLFEDDKAIESNMFGFQTPKRKQSMLAKATGSIVKTPKDVTKTPKDVAKTPKTPATAKNTNTKLKVGVTPRASRYQMKKKISREAARQKFSAGSESEYEPTESSESDETSDDEDVVPLEDVKVEEEPPKEETGMMTRRRKARCNDTNFIFTSDDYFERQGAKSVTSDHNLNKLKNPRLQQDQLMALLKDVHPRHKNVLRELDSENQSMFRRWLFAMSQGFNVLLYGVGSKRTLLSSFHAKHLSSSHVLVINGFFPGITLKDILDSLACGVLKMKNVPGQPHEVVESIAAKLKSANEPDVFVLVHNLDGEVLRVEKTQAVLANLASLPKIHLIASIDHINAPLLWDQNKLSQFNFIWEDATSFLPYFEETSFESSLMVQRSGTIALTALRNVFQSLNVNARRVFRLLMDDQLKNGGKNYQGMLFSDLYRACRNSFIVSSDLALRTQLTEFFDHKLVKHKKDTDHLSIPVDQAVLRQFNDEIASEG
uniref:Origin recognition complex subunit 2 n=1 Tax=Lygus hesperus TaxID=30085 RepID=A0A0A9Y4Q3_LYGHE